MDELTVTFVNKAERVGWNNEIDYIRIDEKEISIVGLTLPQILAHLDRYGWDLRRSTMSPRKEGWLITCDYKKRALMPDM